MRNIILLHCIALLFVLGCSQKLSGGIEEGNPGTVQGIVLGTDSIVTTGAVVTCLPVDYDEGAASRALYQDTTDVHGVYLFKLLPQGLYRISVKGQDGTRYISDTIVLADDTVFNECRLVTVGALKLHWASSLTDTQRVGIPGTPFFQTASIGERALLIDSLPVGSVPTLLNVSTGEEIRTEREIEENKTVSVYLAFRIAVLIEHETSLKEAAVQSQLAAIETICDSISLISADSLSAVDLEGISLLFVTHSTTLDASQIELLRSTSVPIVSGNGGVSSLLGMTGGIPGSDYGTDSPQSMLTYFDKNHPVLTYMAPSKKGTVAIDLAGDGELEWGAPNVVGATVLGSASIDQSHSYLYLYEKGSTMVTGSAPAKRAFVWCGNTEIPESVSPLFNGTLLWGAGFFNE